MSLVVDDSGLAWLNEVCECDQNTIRISDCFHTVLTLRRRLLSGQCVVSNRAGFIRLYPTWALMFDPERREGV